MANDKKRPADKAARQIRAKILRGEIRPGDTVSIDTFRIYGLSGGDRSAALAREILIQGGLLVVEANGTAKVPRLGKEDVEDLGWLLEDLVVGVEARAVADAQPDLGTLQGLGDLAHDDIQGFLMLLRELADACTSARRQQALTICTDQLELALRQMHPG